MDDDRAEYLRAVEACFVGLRGRGFLLSPRDVALVERWRTEGVPLRIVIRGLEEGAKAFQKRNSPGAALPSALAYFESRVDTAAAQWRERMMSWWDVSATGPSGDGPAPRVALLEAAMSIVAAAGQAIEQDAIKAVLRDIWSRLRQSVDRGDEEPWALIARLDSDMGSAVEAALDNETRELIRTEAEGQVCSGSGARMSEAARATRIEGVVVAAIRERVGLPDLVQVVSDADV